MQQRGALTDFPQESRPNKWPIRVRSTRGNKGQGNRRKGKIDGSRSVVTVDRASNQGAAKGGKRGSPNEMPRNGGGRGQDKTLDGRRHIGREIDMKDSQISYRLNPSWLL